MPDIVDPRSERNRISEGRDIYNDIPRPYDSSREDRRTEQDTNLYKEYGFAMTESQKELEDQYKKSIASMTEVYTPISDFDADYNTSLDTEYAKWKETWVQPTEIRQSLSGAMYVGTPKLVPKELTDPTAIGSFLSDTVTWEAAFKDQWYAANLPAYTAANTAFYDAVAKLDQQKTEVYDQLGVRTNNRLYLDESNNYDKTVMNMQQRFEDRMANKQATLNQIMQVK